MAVEPKVFCMSVTPFKENGDFDAVGYAKHLERLVESGTCVYFASPGSGEGHSLTHDELRTVYDVGVGVCKGKVETRANLPEARTVHELLQTAYIAMDAGVDVIQIYTVDPGHGMIPNEREQEIFYRDALDAIDYPTGLAVNLLAGRYITPIGVLKRICDDYPQVVSINVLQPPSVYLAELMDAVGPRVAYYTAAEMLPEGLTLGTQGCLTFYANVVPFLIHSIGRMHAARDIDRCGTALRQLFRLAAALAQFAKANQMPQWHARWQKPAMKILDLPGHGGGRMRHPYVDLMPGEVEQLAEVLRSIDVRGMERDARELVTAARLSAV